MLVLHLIENYSLRGAFLLWSATVSQGFMAVMFYHPVEWHLRPQKIPDEELKVMNHHQPSLNEDNYYRTNDSKIDHQQFMSLENIPDEIFYDVKGRPTSFISVKSFDSFKTTRSTFYKDGDYRSTFSVLSTMDMYQSALSILPVTKQLPFTIEEGQKEDSEDDINEEVKNYFLICGFKVPKLNDILKLELLKKPLFLICCSSSINNRQVSWQKIKMYYQH